MINIYDGMAVCRRRFDKDPLGRGPRGIFSEMLALPKADIAIWTWEGAGSLQARRKIFPGYKVRDSTMTDGLMSLINLVREAMLHTRAIQVAVPGFEADDVIAHLCQTYGSAPVTVHTIDRDLKALETPTVKVACDDLKSIKPSEIRLYKTLVGDASDKIPGMPGFGVETFLKCDRVKLQRAVDLLVLDAVNPGDFEAAGVKLAMAQRICAPEQADLLRAYHQIIGFMPLPEGWEKHIKPGTENPSAGDLVLRQFMH